MPTSPEVRQTLENRKVPSCDTRLLGYAIGHLYDHGLSRTEIEAVVTYIRDGIEKMKNDPETYAAMASLARSIERAT